MLTKMWNDEDGFVISTEIAVVATILVIGVVTGFSSVRDAVVSELADVGQAIGNLDQSFSLRGSVDCSSGTQSSAFFDEADFCDTEETTNVQNSKGLTISGSVGSTARNTGEFQGRGPLPRQWSVKSSRLINRDYVVYGRDVSRSEAGR